MGFTLRDKISMSIGWDSNCFPQGVVEEFWKEVENGIGEFLVGEGEGDVMLEKGLEIGGVRNEREVGARL